MTFSKRVRNSAKRIRTFKTDDESGAALLAEATALDELAREMEFAELAEQNRELHDAQAEALDRLDYLEDLLSSEKVLSLGASKATTDGHSMKEAISADGSIRLEWGIGRWEDNPTPYLALEFIKVEECLFLEYKTHNKRWGTQYVQSNPHTPYTQLPDVTRLLESLAIGPTRKLVTMKKMRRVVHEFCEHLKCSLLTTAP